MSQVNILIVEDDLTTQEMARMVLENAGYRQLTCLWRIQGLVAQVLGRKPVWGVMTRTGFDTSEDEPVAASVESR